MHAACVRLNSRPAADVAATVSTIIVSGASRSGTSLVAAALAAAGLWLGEALDGACFEDTNLAFLIEQRQALHRRLLTAAHHPRQPLLSLRGCDTGALVDAIAQRDAAHQHWGFKRPGIVSRLGDDGLALFRNPRIVLCFRDPIALAQRSVTADGVSFTEALRSARRHIERSLRSAERLTHPVLLVSFEKLRQDRDGFLDELYDFCGLPVERSLYPGIHAAVERGGENYRRLAAAPIAGYIDRPFGWTLSGWCCPPGRKGCTAIDVFANGRKLLTTLADRFRPDLRAAGFRTVRHGFAVDLRRFGLCGPQTIDVMLAGTNISLQDSGFSLAPC